MPPGKAQSGFLLFWAAVCAVWTLAWLLVDFVLVPEPLRVSPLGLMAIGLATSLVPVVVLCAGRAFLYVTARAISFARTRAGTLRAAERGTPAPRGDEYQASAGPL